MTPKVTKSRSSTPINKTVVPLKKTLTLPLVWHNEVVLDILNRLVELKGRQTDTQNFRKVDLDAVARELSAEHGHDFHYKQLSNKINDLKRPWVRWVKHLKHVSGWSNSDGDGEAPSSTTDVEDEHFEAYPECRDFRRRLPPFYDQLQVLFGDKLATGLASVPANELAQSSGDSEDSDVIPWSDSDKEGSSSRRSASVETSASSASRGRKRKALLQQASHRSHRGAGGVGSAEIVAEELPKMRRTMQELLIKGRQPELSTVSKAVKIVTDFKPVKEMDIKRRIALLHAIRQEGHADIIIMLSDDDLKAYLEDIAPLPPQPLSDIATAALAAAERWSGERIASRSPANGSIWFGEAGPALIGQYDDVV